MPRPEDGRGVAGGGGAIEDAHGDGGAAAAAPAAPAAAAGPPMPVAVRNGPSHSAIDTSSRAGMAIAITITSSSGVDADMAAIQDSEQVGLSYGHTGSFAGTAPLPSSQSGFMAGHPIPDDRHSMPKSMIIDHADNKGGDGGFAKKQLDIYTHVAAGVTSPVAIPASGYVIKRSIRKGPRTKITFRTEKGGAACSVNGYTTTAGPSPTQAEDVVVRS